MNIQTPEQTSEIYKQFLQIINAKVSIMIGWLTDHEIEYIWNNWIDNHLYRLYIPKKDLLLDFECYPVNNVNYNYIRVNFDTDVIQLCERIFPKTVVNTDSLTVWKLTQKASNKFLKENNAAPVYYKDVLRVGWVKDTEIYQCIILNKNKIIANVTKKNCNVMYGTYMLLRYLNEMFGIDEILIKSDFDDSYENLLYQILNLPVLHKTNKKKIWWNPEKTKWHIAESERDQYIPFYFSERVIYKYPG